MADVTVQLIIPEAAVPKVVDAFTKAAGARIDMSAHKSTETKEFNATPSSQSFISDSFCCSGCTTFFFAILNSCNNVVGDILLRFGNR